MKLIMSISVAALSMLAGAIIADEGGQESKPVIIHGKIMKMPDDKGIMIILPRDKADPEKDCIKIETNDKTAVIIEGKEAKLSDLKEGFVVRIITVRNLASRIEKLRTDAPKAGA